MNLEALGVTCAVLAVQAIGCGRVAWLSVAPSAQAVTSARARAAESLAIEETGTVALLRVRNRANEPLLVPSDMVLAGGRQTRVVERSVIVPALGDVGLPARCVERKRWAPSEA